LIKDYLRRDRPPLEDVREEVFCFLQGRLCFGLEPELNRRTSEAVKHDREYPVAVLVEPCTVDLSLLRHCFTPGRKMFRSMVGVAVGVCQITRQQREVGLVLLGAGALVDAVSEDMLSEFVQLNGGVVFVALTT